MYADTSDEGLQKLEDDLIEEHFTEFDLDWLSWQLDHHAISRESAWKIIFFLINSDKITLLTGDAKDAKNEQETIKETE